MMITAMLAAAALQGAPETTPIAPAAEPCEPKILGDACLSGAQQDSMSLVDYGRVYVSFTPPADITKAALNAYKGGWKAWVKRYFLPSATYGQLIAEIRRGSERTSPLLAILPLATLTISETSGAKVDTDTTITGSGVIPITPFFKLVDDEVITVVITTKGTTNTSANIVSELTTATKLATQLGGHGWLSSAVANGAVTADLTTIQNKIVSNFDVASGDVSDVKLSFNRTQNLQYRFTLDPRVGAPRSGLLTIQLARQPSLYTKKTFAGTKLADFGVEGQRDLATTAFFLGRSVAPGKTVLDVLTSTAGAQLGTFQTGGANIAQFEAACGVIKSAVQAHELGFNSNDITVAEWALFVSGPYAATEAAQKSDCMAAEIDKFKQQKLDVPPVKMLPVPPTPVPPKLEQAALDDYLTGLFRQLAKEPPASADDDSKRNGLRVHLAEKVDLSFTSAASETLGWLGSSNNKSAIAKGLEPLVFKSGCYYRADDGRVKFLARRASAPADKALYLFEIGLTSLFPATADNTTVTSLGARSANQADIEALKKVMPAKASCHVLETAP